MIMHHFLSCLIGLLENCLLDISAVKQWQFGPCDRRQAREFACTVQDPGPHQIGHILVTWHVTRTVLECNDAL